MPRLRVHDFAMSVDGFVGGRDLGGLPGADEVAEIVCPPMVAHNRVADRS